MTAREIMNGLSDTLLCDERILSVPEKELLTNLLRRAKTQTSVPGNAVAETIADAVGEVIAERAYGILGDSIVQRLLQQAPLSSQWPEQNSRVIRAGSPPTTPPSPGGPDVGPRPPGPSPPGRSMVATASQIGRGATAVMEQPAILAAQPVILDEFLVPAELDALLQYTTEREMQFQASEVVSPGVVGGSVDYEQRRSRVLMDLGSHRQVFTDRLKASLPRLLPKLGCEAFSVSQVEAQITASNHGDFFHWHSDNAQEEVASREITFVYFFHREPKKFRGGDLRIYDSRWENNSYVPTANCHTIVPQQNQMVLFVSALAHEITPVECPSGAFADSRFTVNGWLHR